MPGSSSLSVRRSQTARLSTRRYLMLVFPWLSVERLRSTRPHLFVGREDAPIVFVEGVGDALRLAALDPEAARMGLRVGQTLADARAQLPGPATFAHDPHADLHWLESLADGCARYSSIVTLDPPDGLLLDITDRVYEFEGERPLAADIERRLSRRGVVVRHAFGGTPEVARALARFAGAPAPDETRAVKRLPLAALELDEATSTALAHAGLKTVGDVMNRPLGTISTRFGEDTANAVRRLGGELQAPVPSHRSNIAITVTRRLAEPIVRADHVIEVLAELVAESAVALEERCQGGRRWQARLFRSDDQVQVLRIETGQPTRDASALLRLFRDRIGEHADPLDPDSGYDLVRLDVLLAERLDAAQLKLEGGNNRHAENAGLRDQLTVPIGHSPVRRYAPRKVRSSEQGELLLPPTASTPAAPSTDWPRQDTGEPPPHPIHLFDPPQRIEAEPAEVPDGAPRRFRWRRTFHDVTRAEGPDRIAGDQWRHRDATAPHRAYFRVEDHRGRRFWIFRHGAAAETENAAWYVHGLFA